MSRARHEEDVLYPPIEPFFSGHLQVTDLHSLYYEQSGNPKGIPVVVVHGGPGSGTSPRDRRHFDPKAYHIIMFDQRGAGKSTPAYCLEENDTWSLVADMEKIRLKVGVERWILFGGSWGSTLSLVYAETHIEKVLGLILRGIFTMRPSELAWIYEGGASNLFPDKYDEFLKPIPPEERDNLIRAYHKRLTGDDLEERMKCAIAWNIWEVSISHLVPVAASLQRVHEDANWCLAHSRIEAHYMINHGFMKENQILDNIGVIADSDIPVIIIQGRYDIACPMRTAWDLHQRLPKSEFHIVADSGHSGKEFGNVESLVQACDKMKSIKI